MLPGSTHHAAVLQMPVHSYLEAALIQLVAGAAQQTNLGNRPTGKPPYEQPSPPSDHMDILEMGFGALGLALAQSIPHLSWTALVFG